MYEHKRPTANELVDVLCMHDRRLYQRHFVAIVVTASVSHTTCVQRQKIKHILVNFSTIHASKAISFDNAFSIQLLKLASLLLVLCLKRISALLKAGLAESWYDFECQSAPPPLSTLTTCALKRTGRSAWAVLSKLGSLPDLQMHI